MDPFLQGVFHGLRITLAGGILAVATGHDLHERRVPNKVWMAPILIGLALTAVEAALTGGFFVEQFTASALIVIPLALLAFRMQAIGGADAKAFYMLALLVPAWSYVVPVEGLFPLMGVWPQKLPIFALAVFANAFLLGLIVHGAIVLRNLKMQAEKTDPPWFRLFGYSILAHRLDPVRMRLLQKGSPPWGREFTRQEAEAFMAKEGPNARVFVTPKFPFMVHILVGFLLAYIVGNVPMKLLVG